MRRFVTSAVAMAVAASLNGCAHDQRFEGGPPMARGLVPNERYTVIGSNDRYFANQQEMSPDSAALAEMVTRMNERIRYLERLVKAYGGPSATVAPPAIHDPVDPIPAVKSSSRPKSNTANSRAVVHTKRVAPKHLVHVRRVRRAVHPPRALVVPGALPPPPALTEQPRTLAVAYHPSADPIYGRTSLREIVLPTQLTRMAPRAPDRATPVAASVPELPSEEWTVVYRFPTREQVDEFYRRLQDGGVTPQRVVLAGREYLVLVGTFVHQGPARMRREYLGELTGVYPELRMRRLAPG